MQHIEELSKSKTRVGMVCKNNLFWGQLMVSLMSPTELAMPTKLQCRAGEGESILLVVNGWREANGEDCHPKIEVFFL